MSSACRDDREWGCFSFLFGQRKYSFHMLYDITIILCCCLFWGFDPASIVHQHSWEWSRNTTIGHIQVPGELYFVLDRYEEQDQYFWSS